jgi:phenylpropionate dioxygenase-like ring-hydroxylating dioxygenase large terminal subunit
MSATEVDQQSVQIRSSQAPSSKRNYPANCWWVAATAQEVTRNPLCRWLLDQRVVLFRTEEGVLAALEDRCAHRWAPLSQGKLIGDEIACPYHGFRYNTRGACTHIPTQSHISPRVQVRAYPVHEHCSFVWIWMGNPDRADPTLLPDIPWFSDRTYIQLRTYTQVRCNYMLLHENVLDLTHLAYVHADVQYKGLQTPPATVQVTDHSVTFIVRNPNVPLAPFQAIAMGTEAGKRVNRVDWGTFASPACHFSGTDTEDPAPLNGRSGRYSLRGLHCATPISPNRCHYWSAVAQDYGHEVTNLKEEFTALLESIIKQDTDVLEAIQMTIDQDMRRDNVPENLVASDRAPVEARRILKKMLEAELV